MYQDILAKSKWKAVDIKLSKQSPNARSQKLNIDSTYVKHG